MSAPLKLYLGCGGEPFEILEPHGWTGLDVRQPHPAIIPWEAPDRIPFDDNSAAVVFMSHMLAHLEHGEYVPLFREVYRVLAPRAIVRLQDDLCENSRSDRWPRTIGSSVKIIGIIRSHPTKKKMVRAMRRAGLVVRRARPGRTQSRHKDVLARDRNRMYLYKYDYKIFLEGAKP